uniref:Uncharacterized protein n=1 Tax=Setaria italica TaxID=4555 RepID=K3XRW4_SETIT
MRSDSCSVGQCVLWKAHQSPWRQGWHMVCFAMADTRQTCMGARHTPPIQHSRSVRLHGRIMQSNTVHTDRLFFFFCLESLVSICFCLLDMIFCSNLKQTVGYFCKI